MRFCPSLPARAAICSHARPPTPATTTRTSWTSRGRSFGRLSHFMEVRTSSLSPPTNHPHGNQHQFGTMVVKPSERSLDLTKSIHTNVCLVWDQVSLFCCCQTSFWLLAFQRGTPITNVLLPSFLSSRLTPMLSFPPLLRLPPTQAAGCAVPTCPSEVPAASLSIVAEWMAGMAECPHTFVATLQTEATAQLVSCFSFYSGSQHVCMSACTGSSQTGAGRWSMGGSALKC